MVHNAGNFGSCFAHTSARTVRQAFRRCGPLCSLCLVVKIRASKTANERAKRHGDQTHGVASRYSHQ